MHGTMCGNLTTILGRSDIRLHSVVPTITEIIVSGDIAAVGLTWTLTVERGGITPCDVGPVKLSRNLPARPGFPAASAGVTSTTTAGTEKRRRPAGQYRDHPGVSSIQPWNDTAAGRCWKL